MMDPKQRVYVRAVLVDPTRRAEVLRPLDVITPSWATGEPTNLWEVRLADGRVAVVDPSMVTLRPIPAQLAAAKARYDGTVRRHWVGTT